MLPGKRTGKHSNIGPSVFPQDIRHSKPLFNDGKFGCPAVQVLICTSRAACRPVHQFNFVTEKTWQLGSDTITARYIFNPAATSFNLDECTDCAPPVIDSVPA